MKYLVLGETRERADWFLEEIVRSSITDGEDYIAKCRDSYTVKLKNGNIYQTLSYGENLRGKRVDMVLYDDSYIIDNNCSNVAKEWISWDKHNNKNKYVVELL